MIKKANKKVAVLNFVVLFYSDSCRSICFERSPI